MRITIIGGAGHVGTYLVPMLVQAGHQVTNVTRGQSRPYQAHRAWESVTQVTLDRDTTGFAEAVVATTPEAVIDMICFTRPGTNSWPKRSGAASLTSSISARSGSMAPPAPRPPAKRTPASPSATTASRKACWRTSS